MEKSVDVKPDVKPRVKQELITDHLKVEKKRKPHDRFNGTSKEELMTRTLPDRLKENLDIVFIGERPTYSKCIVKEVSIEVHLGLHFRLAGCLSSSPALSFFISVSVCLSVSLSPSPALSF